MTAPNPAPSAAAPARTPSAESRINPTPTMNAAVAAITVPRSQGSAPACSPRSVHFFYI